MGEGDEFEESLRRGAPEFVNRLQGQALIEALTKRLANGPSLSRWDMEAIEFVADVTGVVVIPVPQTGEQ